MRNFFIYMKYISVTSFNFRLIKKYIKCFQYCGFSDIVLTNQCSQIIYRNSRFIILDLYSRKIVGYRVSRNASTNLVTTTFRNAYQERGKPKNLIFHSDRGKQYTSGAFIQLLQANGVKQSFSATGRPHDNAVAETFFGTFKKEEAYRREYTSEQSFRKSVEQYIQFYNEVRPHQTLKYQTPQAFEDRYYAKFTENLCSNDVME